MTGHFLLSADPVKRVPLWLMQFNDNSLERRTDSFTAVSTIALSLKKPQQLT